MINKILLILISIVIFGCSKDIQNRIEVKLAKNNIQNHEKINFDKYTNPKNNQLVYISKNSEITEFDMQSATTYQDPIGFYVVSIKLSKQGTTKLKDFTGANVGNLSAIFIDSKIHEVFKISAEIPSGQMVIQELNQKNAMDLADYINELNKNLITSQSS